jgi:hypothetical protein
VGTIAQQQHVADGLMGFCSCRVCAAMHSCWSAHKPIWWQVAAGHTHAPICRLVDCGNCIKQQHTHVLFFNTHTQQRPSSPLHSS